MQLGVYRPPEPIRSVLRWLLNAWGTWRADRWIRHTVEPFSAGELDRLFLSIALFAMNNGLKGDYFEFGCHGGDTMRRAWRSFRYACCRHYVAFDSFEGLPPVEAVDELPAFEAGQLKTGEAEFIALMAKAGMPRECLTTVKGFYRDSLTPALRARLMPRKAAVIYVDCDLYHSTVPVLAFVKDFLQVGTVIVFDDWNCYFADPARGERRAWQEFRASNPELRFEPFVATSRAQAFVFTGAVGAPRAAEPPAAEGDAIVRALRSIERDGDVMGFATLEAGEAAREEAVARGLAVQHPSTDGWLLTEAGRRELAGTDHRTD
jgi:hypothetical protein